MIINDELRFAFVHIPKCAGSSVRHALAKIDDRMGRYYCRGVDRHPELGEIDFHHLPLKIIKAYYPDDYACLESYETFALVRDPVARFPSSLAQRLGFHYNVDVGRLSKAELLREIDSTIEHLKKLDAHEPITDPSLIHFSRQSDYVFLENRQLIRNVYPLERTDAFVREVSRQTGLELAALERRNTGPLKFENPLADLAYRGLKFAAGLLMERKKVIDASVAVGDWLLAKGLFRASQKPHNDVFSSDYVLDFVRDFYADDLQLHARSIACGGSPSQIREQSGTA